MKLFNQYALVGLVTAVCFLPPTSHAQVDFTSSNLPIVVINTNGAEIVDEPKINVSMGIIDNSGGQRNKVTDPFNDFDGTVGIEIRGSTSQSFPKKQYSVEVRNPDSSDSTVSLLGMPAESDWVLHAPYSDKSLMRNVLTYQLARSMGRYAPRTRLCEVVLNGDYQGVYVLMERIKRDKNRVDVSKLKDDDLSGEDVTGGYIIKIDKDDNRTEEFWRSDYAPPFQQRDDQRITFRYEYPDSDDIAPEQKAYIQGFVGDFEDALAGDNFADPTTGYARYIDVGSFVDFFVINEVSKNLDAYRLSTYMHKQKDTKGGKLVMGPIWDYNFSFGNDSFCTESTTKNFALNFSENCSDDFWLAPFWWSRLLEDPAYSENLGSRWAALRQGELSNARILERIDSVTTLVEEAQVRNFTRWPILGEQVLANAFVGDTYEEEVDYLKNWTTQRLTWLDENFPEATATTPTDPVPGDTVVTSLEDPAETAPVLYPNPLEDKLSVRFTAGSASAATVQIYDLLGRPVLLPKAYRTSIGEHEQQLSWDTSSLSPGVYVLQLWIDGRRLMTKRVSKR